MHVNEDVGTDTKTPEVDAAGGKRRSLMGVVAAGEGGAAIFGPSKEDRVYSQAAPKKPHVIGLTMDAA
jgi:hypothetical protein